MDLFKNALIQRWKTLNEGWRIAIVAFLGVRVFYALWSLIIFTVQPLAVQDIELSGESIVTIFNLKSSQAYIYLREINGQILTFHAGSEDTIIDLQTESIWDISTGKALAGHYKGSILQVSKTAPSEIFPYHHTKPYTVSWLALWQRFDANWYATIAENSYGSITEDIHFPPLFPLLIRLLKPLFGNAFLAGLFISHIAAVYAIKLLYDAFREWGGILSANRSILFLLVYPTSFFFFSAYTESLFLVMALLALREIKTGSWAWAGFWTFCAILTRLQGVALIVPMIYQIWLDRPFLGKTTHWFGLMLPGLGGLFYLFLRARQLTNNFMPFTERDLHAHIGSPWASYWYAIQTLISGKSTFIDLLNWVVVTLFMVLLVSGWRKIPLDYSLYFGVSLIALVMRIVETQPLNSMLRYSLTLFPAFFVLGTAGENPWRRRLILYTFIPLNLYLSAQFFLWGWVA